MRRSVSDTFRKLGIWGYVLVGIFIIVAGYFIILHEEHLAAYSGVIFLILFVVLHLFMHSGHGSHGKGGSREGPDKGHGGHEGTGRSVESSKESEHLKD